MSSLISLYKCSAVSKNVTQNIYLQKYSRLSIEMTDEMKLIKVGHFNFFPNFLTIVAYTEVINLVQYNQTEESFQKLK